MKFLDIDEILAEEERISCIFSLDASGLGGLDPTSNEEDLAATSKVELPLWLAQMLMEKNIVDIELPKYYGNRIRQDILAGASSVRLREFSFYYFEVGCKICEITRDDDLKKILRMALSGERYTSLVAHAMSNFQDDIASYTQGLTSAELVLFNDGYSAAKALLQWRTGQSGMLVQASILGKKAASTVTSGAHASADSGKRARPV